MAKSPEFEARKADWESKKEGNVVAWTFRSEERLTDSTKTYNRFRYKETIRFCRIAQGTMNDHLIVPDTLSAASANPQF